MVKYCVANECPIDEWTCACAALEGHLEVLKYLREEAKAPWDSGLPLGRLQNGHLHILEYLVERKYDQYHELRVRCSRERPLGLFEVLTRNRQSAVGLLGRTSSAREQPHRVCTIPPRERLSSPTRLAIRTWSVTHLIKTHTKRREAKGAKEF